MSYCSERQLFDPAGPRWLRQSTLGFAPFLLMLGAIVALLQTPGSSAVPVSLPPVVEAMRVPAVAPETSRHEGCPCPGFGTDEGDIAAQMGPTEDPRGPAADLTRETDHAAVTIDSAGAVRAGLWQSQNTRMLERDPRAFLKLMAHLARFKDRDLVRLPGKAPTLSRGPEDGGRRTEDGGRGTEDGGRKLTTSVRPDTLTP